MKFTYLAVDFFTILLPFIFSFHPRLQFHKQWYAFWPANLLVASAFLLWDHWFTGMGVWGFSPQYVTGLYLFLLPVEEVLFFICIPYACVFTYHCFRILCRDYLQPVSSWLTGFLIAAGVAVAVVFYDRWYTVAAFSLLSLVLSILLLLRVEWLSRFLFAYLVLLIPFFIVNGILTGTGLEQPVVWYNDDENMGVRIFTIPVEDIFYGMLLLLLNTGLYERIRKIRG